MLAAVEVAALVEVVLVGVEALLVVVGLVVPPEALPSLTVMSAEPLDW